MSTLRSGLCRPGIILYLALVLLAARSTHSAPMYETDSTQVAEYDGSTSGCYYNFQRYQEGARIITNEPCLNCTCHNRMLMCYLRVCPFTKAIGQDCTVEKRPDQCCPVITCPEVPVQLLTSTTSSPSKSSSSSSILPAGSSSTELGFPDTYGCNVNDRFFADGAQLPVDSNNPCELCYCIRNKTTCLMQQCTLSVAGCRPVYQPGICCPVKYNCEYDEDTTAGTTPGLIMTTTLAPHSPPLQCHHDGKMYEDGELIYTIQPCQHCYCFHGDIVCAVQNCGDPMKPHSKNCTALPPLEGECCPTTYQCEDDFGNISTEIPQNEDKNVPQQSIEPGKDQQESFPGADNAIPEEIITDSTLTTEQPQTISPFGNEVSELEPTASTIIEDIAKENKFTTLKPESEEVTESAERQHLTISPSENKLPVTESTLSSATEAETKEEAHSTLNPEKDESSESSESQQPEGKMPEPASVEAASEVTSTNKISDETEPSSNISEQPSTTLSLTIEEEITPEVSKEESPITESNILEEASTESKSQIDIEFTTLAAEEKATEKSNDEESISAIATEKEVEESDKHSTPSTESNDELEHNKPTVIVTESQIAEESTTVASEEKEKSSEPSSPISTITTTEQNIRIDVTESEFSTASIESEQRFDTSQDENIKHDQMTTVKPSTEEHAVEQTDESIALTTGIPQEVDAPTSPESFMVTSSDGINKSISTIPEIRYDNSITESPIESKSSEEAKEPSSSESSTEDVISDDAKPKEVDTIVPERSTSSNEVKESEEPGVTDISEISTNIEEGKQTEKSEEPVNLETSTTAEVSDKSIISEEVDTVAPAGSTASSSEDKEIEESITLASPKISTAESVAEEKQPAESEEPVNTETSTANISAENAKSEEAGTIKSESSAATTSSEDVISEESVTVSIPESSVTTVSDEQKQPETDLSIPKETSTLVSADEDENKITKQPVQSDTTEELISATSASVTIDTEKLNSNEVLSQSTTEIQTPSQSASEENTEEPVIPEQGPAGIPMPSRVPEYKAEDKDAVTDVGITEVYFSTGNGILHNVDNLITEYPEYGSTTYLPPLGSSTETDRQPSTPLYEDLPKEDTIGDTTEVSITPKISSEQTTTHIDETSDHEDHEIQTETPESSSDMLEEKEPVEEGMIITKAPIEEIKAETSSTDVPAEEHTLKEMPTTVESKISEPEITQTSTDKPLSEEMTTQLPILIDQTTEEEEEELKDKSEVLAELTTISAEEHTKSSEIDVEKISEETSDEEKVMTESPKQTEESTQVSEIELSTKQILKDTTVSESTEKAIDDQQPTKESETTTSSETISEESTELGTANEDHVIDSSEQSSSTESEEESVGDVVLPTESHIISEPEVNKPDISEETSEKSMEIPELSITTTSSLTDKVTEFVEKVETIPDEIINEEKENLPTKEPEDSRDKESPIVPTSIDLSTEIPAKETKLSDEQTTKGTLLTESEISSQSTLNNKFESDKPQYHDIISSTSSMIESVTDSSDSEFTSTLGSSEPLEEDKPSEISSETEKELTHSTQSTLTISSQTPEIEITSSAEPDVWPIAGIPGEGNCLVDGQSYTNNSAIPPANSCQLSCRCVSSIVQCELVQCSPPPSNLLNCTPIFSEADSCCPMYTCDSTPSVKLEAGNQMSDHHTPTYEDESQPQTSHPSIVDATSELTTFTEKVKSNEETTESLNKSQLEIAESTSIAPEAEKESVPPASPVEGETMSPSTSTESTSATPAESGVSVQMNIEESSPSHTPIETTNIQKESASETTESIQVTSIKSIEVDKTEATDKEVTISSQKPEIESVSEKEMNEPEQTTESTEEISKPSLEEEMPAVPIETSSSTQNVPDEETNEVSTQSTKLTTDEIEKTDTDMSIQGEEHTEKTQENVTPESAFQTTYSSAEPTKAETQKETSESTEIPTSSEETKLTSEDSQESVTPMTEDKIVEEETQEPKDVDLEHSSLPTEISSLGSDETSQKMNTEPSEVLVEETTSTSILSEVDTSKPTKSESESLTTVLPEKQSTLTSITTETEDKTTESTGTEKIFEISDSTVSSEPSSSTEENLTVAVMVNQPEESHSPVFTITETPEETTVVEKSQEEPEQSTTLSPTESHPTESSELVELPQSTSEIELTSSTSPSTMSSSDENVPDQTITNAPDQNKTYPEVDQTESEDTATASSTEKLDKKPQEVTTESFEETSKETVTTTAGETEKLRPTESLLEVEKETSEPFAKTTESAIEIKVPINTELPQVSEDKEEDVQTITTEISKLHESSPSTAEEPSSTIRESEHPFESSTESHVEKAEAASTHTTNEPEITTLAKVDEETSSKEPLSTPELTKIEIPSEEHNQQTPTESSNAELMPTTGEESSDETSTEHDKKSHSTEATISEVSSGDLTPTENESEKEHSIESNISEEPTFEVSAGEIQTTTAHEKHEQSTKAAVPQDESTSSKPSEVTSSEDNQYQIDSQQTEEPVIPGLHNNEEERPIESTPYSEISKPHTRPEYPDEQKPETDDENIFPPEEADIKSPLHPDEPETDDYDDQAVYGPGTCRYGGKIYMSAQQIPRDDPCDFCFCFRSDIICLQQSCPPPIPGCHEEPIGGFCCPRYECPVSMATSVNITTTTTTTTTTLPPHFLSHAYKGSAFRGGCQIGNKSYRVGEDIKSKSGPCMGCTCGGDGKMKCEPKACSASPMLKEMIAHAAARKRRR